MDETNSDGLSGSAAEHVKRAKARFARLSEGQIQSYLQSRPDIDGTVALERLHFPTTGAGSSNGTAFVLATVDGPSGSRVLDLVLRYDPGVRLIQQKSYSDEYRTIAAAGAEGIPVPKLLWLDEIGDELGAIGFFMERIEGELPALAMFSAGPLADVTPQRRKELMLEGARFHGRLRRAAIGPDKVPHLANRGRGKTAVERELDYWRRDLEAAGNAEGPRAAMILDAMRWMIENEPADLRPASLVHGDAQIANLIFRDGKIVAAIDWELSHIGYAELDIIFMEKHAEYMLMVDRKVDGIPTRAEYVAAFEEAAGAPLQHLEYFDVLNCIRSAVVVLASTATKDNFEAIWKIFEKRLIDAVALAKEKFS